MKTLDTGKITATVIGVAFGLTLALGLHLASRRPDVGPTPAPAPISKTGEHVIVIVDNTSPSIPQGIILDSPLFRALKVSGKCSICEMREEWTKAHGFDKLLTEAGGAPAILILDHDGGRVYAGRLPTDAKAADKLLEQSMANLPAPLAAWPFPQVVNRGGELPTAQDANGTFVDVGGHRRYLGAKFDRARLGAMAKYGDSNPTFPVNEWHDIDRRNLFGGADWILDQNGFNSCVANGNVGAYRRLRVLYGMNDVPLSPGFLYSLINGGKDQGAFVTDGAMALQKVGTCTFATVPQKPIYPRQMPAGAKLESPRFKLAEYYRCDTWEETCSALQTGRFVVVYGVQVGKPSGAPGNFGHFDRYGVAGHDVGPGNHCMHADGMKKLPDGRWVLDNVNSWGQWGPFNNGRCYLDKQHLFNGSDQPSVVVMRLPGRDPSDPFDPPAYKGK